MSGLMRALMAPAVIAAGLFSLAGSAVAAPASGLQVLKDAVPVQAGSQVEHVRWHGRRGWGHGRGWGWGGFAAGAIIGGALASRPYYSGYYGYGPTYYYEPYYAPPPPPAYYSGGGDDVAYCMQRFKSYDPRSGTYLGYDGRRHPCP